MKAFTSFIFESLMELTDAQRFDIWRKARDRYLELKRQNKNDEYAKRLYRIACTAMHWNS